MMKFRILHYPVLDSTNNRALDYAAKQAAEGTVVVADYQTKGRGRFERTWISRRAKDLLFSILLRPRLSPSRAPILTHVAASSVADVLQKTFRLPAKLKAPNDVMVNGKKICGILTESSVQAGRLDHVVLGIGLNVNSAVRDLPTEATSVWLETRKRADRPSLLQEILTYFDDQYVQTTQ